MTFADLPAAVRARLLAAASAALGSATAQQVPAELAAVARFAPARRARTGAVALSRVLDSDPAFRALTAVQLTRGRPGPEPVADDDDTAEGSAEATGAAGAGPGGDPEAVDDVDRLALAYLRGGELPQDAWARLTAAEELTAARTRIAELEAELARRPVEGRRQRAGKGESTGQDGDVGSAEVERLTGRLDRLTQRLREQGVRLREAQDRAEAAERTGREELAAAQARADAAERARTVAERRAASAAERLAALDVSSEQARSRQAHERAVLTRRVELLLDTVEAAAAGLRRQWSGAPAGPGAGVDPADEVARRWRDGAAPAPSAIGDTGRLTDVLALPGVHLLVDGYNVTKTGFGHLTLAEQRDRLVRLLTVLSTRTDAEMTVVFDGAGVAAPPVTSRRIRVLFSPPDVIADDVLVDLVAAEPAGRPLLVVTSDRAVQSAVGARGAYVAPSEVLLSALAR